MKPPFHTLVDDATRPEALGASPTVLVIGNFDGVHKGHQAVLADARRVADARALPVSVLTFTPHPAGVLGRGEPPVLTPLERKAELLLRCGASRVYARKFDMGFAAWSPERFVRDLLVGLLHTKVVVVGADFRFGAQRAGDFAMLGRLGGELGFEAKTTAIASDDRAPYKSSRARSAVVAGDLDEAKAVLGRPHSIAGTVVHGDARGRTIGFPTANLEGVVELLPPNGVYAVTVDERTGAGPRALAKGVMNVGVRPTVGGGDARRVEVHLFDLDRDLYGATLRVHLVARLRDERKFDGLDALKAQIARDAEEARRALASVEPVDGAFG
jgi:riboflavin kinase/FMN adenylyltransferase